MSGNATRRRIILATVAAVAATVPAIGTSTAATAAPAVPIYQNTSFSFAERAADLVSRMTLSEKVLQLHTNNAPAIPRLGVQQYTYWSEGQHGLNRLGADTAEGGQGAVDDVHSTSFPTNFASSMSWDPSLIYQETTAISDEARGYLDKSLFGTGQNNLGPSASDYGDLTFWAPTVNLDRDPLWGRTDEAFGEDPYLVGQMAGAFINGYQGNDQTGKPMTPYLKVAATAKHYAMNNVEANRLSGDSVTSDADLRQYYTKQFQTLIETDHVSGMMTSYNAINGTPSAVDTYTLDDLAQRTYGFAGYTTSDCDAVNSAWAEPPGGHAWAAPGWTSSQSNGQVIWTNNTTHATIAAAAGAEAYALRAGTQLVCTGDEATLPNVTAAISAGLLSEGVLDTDLVRLFTMRMATGEFDPASANSYTSINKSVIESPAHQQLARTVADNSLVLLKNSNVTGTSSPLLPVSASGLSSVVILGDMANTVTLGGYSGQPDFQTTAVAGITAAVHAASPNATVTFAAAGTSSTTTSPAVLSAATQTAIRNASLVIVFAGTNLNNASEGKDRTTLAMPGNYNSLVDQVSALGNPKTALVLQSAGPVNLSDAGPKVPAILFSGYNGQAQGSALADVLFGAQNPSGHLNFTWYADDTQLAAMQNYGLDAASTGGLGRTYQYFTGTPTYPFGFGMSYSSFAISNVATDTSSVTADGTVNVSMDVKNTGTRAGTTVAQLYVATPGAGTGDIPIKRLAGFAKTQSLAPGATQHVVIPVSISGMELWNTSASKMAVTDGTYNFQVGTSSSAIVATKQVTVTGAITPKVQYVTVQPTGAVFQAGQSVDLTAKNPWLADDTDTAEEADRNLNIKADNIVQAVNNDESFVNLAGATVTYASGNPTVATVSSAGLVRAVSDGATTITVTVNGVSGTMPISVQGTLHAAVPAVAPANQQATASATFTNGGATTVQNVALSIAVPSGWTATATTPTSFAQVNGQSTATSSWHVTPPAGTAPGTYPLNFTATSSEGTFTFAGQTTVPFASMAAAYDNAGISNDGSTPTGSFDGGNLNFSAQALAAVGFTAGQTHAVNGVNFTWVSPNQSDNVVTGGQAVPVSGSGSTLAFLGASNNGTGSGTGTIVYTDGTTSSYALGFADWWSGSAIPGTSIAATLPYLNNGSGKQTQTVHVYFASVPLTAGKTVRDVILPNVTSNGQVSQITALHVFAIGIA
ncbi:MAG TPA: glycoside hydrolase family 3 C-terminal domain-containing protein [Pseudonocardiaceae bacterium]|jgi:beta-glucosidase-like glycosyl hydrolase|nr:glycoside hydrolase family 3 C-terminal domain-containing protein [Pseudonocardiaceae bacterium]